MAYEKSRWLTGYGTPLWTASSTSTSSTLDNWNNNDWTTYIDPSGWSNSTAYPPAFQWNAGYNDFIPPSTFEDLLTFVPQSLTSKEIDELTKFYQTTLKKHMADSTQDSDQDHEYGVFFSAYQECQLILKDEKSYLEKKFQDIENEINDIKSQMLFASAEEDQAIVTDLTLRLPALEGKKSLNSSDRYEIERLIATAEHRMMQFERYLSFKSSFKNSSNNPSNISWKLNPVTGDYEGIMTVDGYVYTLSMDPITNEMNTTVTKSESGL